MPELTDRQEAVLDIIQRFGRGRACKLPAETVCEMAMDYHAVRVSTREVGATCAELVAVGYPIAGTSAGGGGYFIPADKDEARRVARELRRRALGTLRHRRRYCNAVDNYFQPQPELTF